MRHTESLYFYPRAIVLSIPKKRVVVSTLTLTARVLSDLLLHGLKVP